MTEQDRAIRDLRKDVIDEVASAMPGASASEVVAAIVARLSAGLPPFAELEMSQDDLDARAENAAMEEFARVDTYGGNP